ncbi:MAG: tRNA uridine-5-carboxymethylaminomethyl(34) synthesis GTPase MnmE [Vicinamibacterales bacterium]
MYSPDDTIVAIATPPGRGGLGVVRVSGPEALVVAQRLTARSTPLVPRHATLARTTADAGAADQVVLTYFKAPHSYTGEDVVEISAHGSPVLLRAIVRAAMGAGSRLAEPGEFTLRAYLRGRIDLVQAEAVRDLVDAVTPLQARAAFDQLEGTLTERIRAIDTRLFDLAAKLEASLDFPEEGYHFVATDEAVRELTAIVESITALLATAARGRLIREGVLVAIVGRPNAGKSSLFNQLAGAGRAIVAPLPGTTRDVLTETIDVDGVPMTIVDTAGVRRQPGDEVEAEGIARAVAAREAASLTVLVLDRSAPMIDDDLALIEQTAGRPRVVVANKADLAPAWHVASVGGPVIEVSARTGRGVEALRRALTGAGDTEATRDTPAVTNLRHVELLERAREALRRARDAAAAGTPEEFVLSDVHDARSRLEEVTGARTPDDLLHAIFAKFCIGK